MALGRQVFEGSMSNMGNAMALAGLTMVGFLIAPLGFVFILERGWVARVLNGSRAKWPIGFGFFFLG